MTQNNHLALKSPIRMTYCARSVPAQCDWMLRGGKVEMIIGGASGELQLEFHEPPRPHSWASTVNPPSSYCSQTPIGRGARVISDPSLL